MIEWKQFNLDFAECFDSLDRERPYETILTGGYQFAVKVNDAERKCWVYYPSGMEYSCRNILMLLPNHMSASAFLESTGWKEIADREKILLVLGGGAEEPWTADGDDAYIAALDAFQLNRTYMDTKRAYGYLAAYGEGVLSGSRYAALHPEFYAGAAFCGEISVDKVNFAQIGDKPFLGTDIRLKTISLPVMLYGAQDERVVDYWKNANRVEPEAYYQGDMKIWMENQIFSIALPDRQAVGRVQYNPSEDYYGPQASEAICAFLARAVRGPGVLDGTLHSYRAMDESALHRQERVIDGYTRHWYEFVPERQHILTDGKMPLVIFLHGGSASAVSDLYFHEWVQVAKERGFILALPTSAMRKFDNMMPHPAWNAAQVSHMMDDEKFICRLIDDIASRFPIDKGRVYINGHSMGAAMTQRMAMCMPKLFAAAASNSGVVTGGFKGNFDSPGVTDSYDIPIWIQMGEHDIGGAALEEGGNIAFNQNARNTVSYWINRYGLDPLENPGHWRAGRYLHKEWKDSNGVPMLHYTIVLEKPHSIMPQDAWMYYDEFFCKFSRREDGTLLYQGKEVKSRRQP